SGPTWRGSRRDRVLRAWSGTGMVAFVGTGRRVVPGWAGGRGGHSGDDAPPSRPSAADPPATRFAPHPGGALRAGRDHPGGVPGTAGRPAGAPTGRVGPGASSTTTAASSGGVAVPTTVDK